MIKKCIVIKPNQKAWLKQYIYINTAKKKSKKWYRNRFFLNIDEQCSFWKNYFKC